MLKFTPGSPLADADAEPQELALHARRAGQFASPSASPSEASPSEVDAENLEDGSLQPESNAADTVDEEEEEVRGDLQTREAYLKKGEDLIRSLL